MKLFNKLANILFDEEVEDEIPVITKEEVKSDEVKEDEIIVTKVETKKEEAVKEVTKEMPKVTDNDTQTKKFSFPFIDDDEEEIPKRSEGKTIDDYSYASTTQEIPTIRKHSTLISRDERKNARSDAYTASRNNIYDKTRDENRPFTLSPIISPVYGILNENYTKDDIVERNVSNNERIDFDSVRRKAYGTLEDEIEVSLTKKDEDDITDEVPEKDEMRIENLKDDGISISDLLVGDEEEEKTGEIFRVDDEDEEIIESDETIEVVDEE